MRFTPFPLSLKFGKPPHPESFPPLSTSPDAKRQDQLDQGETNAFQKEARLQDRGVIPWRGRKETGYLNATCIASSPK